MLSFGAWGDGSEVAVDLEQNNCLSDFQYFLVSFVVVDKGEKQRKNNPEV